MKNLGVFFSLMLTISFSASGQVIDAVAKKETVWPDHSWFYKTVVDLLLTIDLYQLQMAETRNKTEAQVRQLNSLALQKMQTQPSVGGAGPRRSNLTFDEIATIQKSIYLNQVATPYNTTMYGQPGTEIGYCFGRAMFYHLALLRNRVDKSAVRKAFIVGPMTAFGNDWQFHVATIVKGPEGAWYALDPNFSQPQELTKWYETHFAMGNQKNVRLYITDPKKFTPTSDYDKLQLGLTLHRDIDWYRGYFQDLMKSFRALNEK